jgi:hypothetical protein
MPKYLSDLRLKTKKIISSFPISFISAPILISLLKHKNIICINNEINNKIRIIIRQIQNKIINLKKLEYYPYLT